MILGFYQKIGKRPTYFREKILSCVKPIVHQGLLFESRRANPAALVPRTQLTLIDIDSLIKEKPNPITVSATLKAKRHTIRQDKSKRWKPGRKISMVYRGPKYSIADHFNKNIPELEECKSVQVITIKWRRPTWLQKQYGNAIPPFTVKIKNQYVFIYIDQKLIGHKTLRYLAINDGFDSITDFLHHFRKSIKDYRLIHWTSLTY